ncbi:MAG: SAM-dependent methyltransferase, partial [Pseudomonadota bacterium]
MRPEARAQSAIEILDRWLMTGDPAERCLAEWGRANRYAGSGDRRAIADHVYDAIRRRRSAAWLSGDESGRGLIHGLLRLAGGEPDGIFTGGRHAPGALTTEERAAGRVLPDAPWGVRHDLPDWLEPSLGHLPIETLDRFGARAPLDLRVNTLRADVAAARAALDLAGIEAVGVPDRPTCLRVVTGAHKVHRAPAYLDGLVEIQDASSQAVARFAGARPGETVLDLCAGGGGKTLALAAAMGNTGHLIAHDIAPARLAQVPPRAERAGAVVSLADPAMLEALEGRCDLVFADAPCSGSGSW